MQKEKLLNVQRAKNDEKSGELTFFILASFLLDMKGVGQKCSYCWCEYTGEIRKAE